MTFIDALLTEEDISRLDVLKHWMQRCAKCDKGQEENGHWSGLCEEHAPLARAYLDPSYLPFLRHERQICQERIALFTNIITLQGRITKNREGMQDKPERAERWQRQIDLLLTQIPFEYREIPIVRIQEMMRRREDNSQWLDQRIQACGKWIRQYTMAQQV